MSFATLKEKGFILITAGERRRTLDEQFNFQVHFGFLLDVYQRWMLLVDVHL